MHTDAILGYKRTARSRWEAIGTNEIARTWTQIMTFVVRAQHSITLAGRNKELRLNFVSADK